MSAPEGKENGVGLGTSRALRLLRQTRSFDEAKAPSPLRSAGAVHIAWRSYGRSQRRMRRTRRKHKKVGRGGGQGELFGCLVRLGRATKAKRRRCVARPAQSLLRRRASGGRR